MSTKPKTKLPDVPAISKAELKSAQTNETAVAIVGGIAPAGLKITSEAFETLGGEIFAGLNILRLMPGEAAGPFRLLTIEKDKEISGKPGRKAKGAVTSKVTQYVAEHVGNPGRKVLMPIAASFVAKCEEATLSVGDTFALRRGENYTDKTYGQSCQSYELRVLTRATPPV